MILGLRSLFWTIQNLFSWLFSGGFIDVALKRKLYEYGLAGLFSLGEEYFKVIGKKLPASPWYETPNNIAKLEAACLCLGIPYRKVSYNPWKMHRGALFSKKGYGIYL